MGLAEAPSPPVAPCFLGKVGIDFAITGYLMALKSKQCFPGLFESFSPSECCEHEATLLVHFRSCSSLSSFTFIDIRNFKRVESLILFSFSIVC